MTTLTATEPIIRARLRKAKAKRYARGVLGLRAKPEWNGNAFDYEGTQVTVVPCPSVLALWEAIDTRDTDAWTVVLTDVVDDDLSDTVLAHLLDGRLITPDPWDALRSNFAASTIEPALYRPHNDRAIANGLLNVLAPDAYTAAPGGVLTLDHAMATVARDVLKIVNRADVEIDTLAVLEWSLSAEAADDLAVLADRGGTELAVAFHGWLAGRAAAIAGPLTALLRADRITDLVPLGIVAGLFSQRSDTDHDAKALGVFLGRYGLTSLTPPGLDTWSVNVRGLVTNSLTSPHSVLQAAAAVVDDLGLGATAASSELLRHGLDHRLKVLADAVTPVLTRPETLPGVENAWADVQNHFLHESDPSCPAFAGAVRLVRWLAQTPVAATGLAAASTLYVRDLSWVDTALVAARRGADAPHLAEALRAVIDTVAGRRAQYDRAFAKALADAPKPPLQTVEKVLAQWVIPLAKKMPTLLLVIDALSLAAANDLVTAAQRDGWVEISAAADGRRGAALAVLPTLTQRSRCSLLCGELREGPDGVERAGFVSLIREAQLQATGGVPDPIFHKKALGAIPAGASLATDVNNSIADTEHQRLVAAVLNYVDDTLHHTDPGGTDWTLTTITHLRALLHAAKNAGRAVVITSDHGHLIEYGTSTKVDRANVYGQRAHGDYANVDPDREVVVEGPRVLTADHKVVLAVDPDVRYQARNAGYHGGGSPAEALVPVVVLASGPLPDGAVPVAGAEPPWWHTSVQPVVTRPVKTKKPQEPSLFDIAEQSSVLPEKVLRSKVFSEQLKLAKRNVLQQSQIGDLLAALLATSAHEITLAQAAVALGVATASVNGALMQTKRVLDVEGYEVLRVTQGVVRLDVDALKEQFGVSE